jgi:hypothetical protein
MINTWKQAGAYFEPLRCTFQECPAHHFNAQRNVMSLLLIIAATVAIFVYIGRTSTPVEERRPMARSPREIGRNFWKGLGVVSSPSPVNQALDAFDRDIVSRRSDSADGEMVSSNRLSQTRVSNF